VRQLFLAIFERLAPDIDRHVVDAADAGAGVVDDIGQRGGGESAGGEHVGRGVEDALLCRIGVRQKRRVGVSGSLSPAAPSTESSEGAAVVIRRSYVGRTQRPARVRS
jgi:hypothetical protein